MALESKWTEQLKTCALQLKHFVSVTLALQFSLCAKICNMFLGYMLKRYTQLYLSGTFRYIYTFRH